MAKLEGSGARAVNELLDEGRQYQEWLAALEAKRAVTPTHIYARVQADYCARLQRVSEQLAAHKSAVEEMLASLTDRLTSLDIDDAKWRDEREEAALRALVGEFTEEQRIEAVARADAAAAGIEQERAATLAEVARLRGAMEGGAEQLARGAADAGAVSRHMESAPAGEPGVAATAPGAVDTTAEAGMSSGVQPLWMGSDEAGTAAAPINATSGEQAAGFDELSFIKSMATSAGAAAPVADAPPGGDPDAHDAAGEARARELRESIPSFLKDVPAEQVKTLKCQECGTLNYPTEWYCERCGAELAAL